MRRLFDNVSVLIDYHQRNSIALLLNLWILLEILLLR
jgi:hypothetical protein